MKKKRKGNILKIVYNKVEENSAQKKGKIIDDLSDILKKIETNLKKENEKPLK